MQHTRFGLLMMAGRCGGIELFVERNIGWRGSEQQRRAAMVKNRLHRLAAKRTSGTGWTVCRH